jgi:Helix-turn-helix domain
MALCWPLKLPLVAKSVLVSLADNANDDGFCWPSIDTISERTCASRRAVIEAIKALEN